MNIAQLSEQLKDVPQNRLVDYAQNPNSVVPQFLALAEIQRRQQLGSQVQPPQSTVANDVLAQAQPMPQGMPAMPPQEAPPQMAQMAQQLPENQAGVPQLQANVAPQGFAGGGIVAFADGGLSLDDDDEADREDASLFSTSRLAGITDMLASIPAGVRSLVGKVPEAFQSAKQAVATGAEEIKKGAHKYEQAVIDEAKRQGIDPKLALHVLYKETGNLPDPEKARSRAGAMGVMQLMPKTAAGLGVDPTDPAQNIRGGVSYLKQMYSKYGDPKLAAAAYNAGPGNLDKALRRPGGLETLPRETRNYIAGLAQGGEVKGYSGEDGESDVKEDNDYLKRSRSVVDTVKSAYDALTTPKNYDLYDMYQRNIGQPFSRGVERFVNEPLGSQAERFRSLSMTPEKTPEVGYSRPVAPSVEQPVPVVSDRAEVDRLAAVSGVNRAANKEGLFAKPSAAPTPTMVAPNVQTGPYDDELKRYATAAAPETPKTNADLLRESLEADIKAQAEKAAKEGNMTLAMSILQAGLGMMASKSPYALGGIGEGGQQGVSTFAALKKQEAERAKDLMAARLGLYKYGALQERGQQEAEALREYRLGKQALDASTSAENRQRHYARLYEIQDQRIKQQATNNVKLAVKDQGLTPEEINAKIQEEERRLMNMPRNVAIMKNLESNMGLPPMEEAPTYSPLPMSKDALVTGNIYNTSKGPARWDGKQFIPAK